MNKKKHNKATADRPFPETDYSPGLQRTLKEKFDKGEIDTVDREEFFKLLGHSAPPEEPDQAS